MKVFNKRIVAISLIIALLATFIPVVKVNADSEPTVTISASKTSVKPGDEFVVTIDFANGISAQKALSFAVNYDSTKLTVKEDYVEEDEGNSARMLGDEDGQSLNHTMGTRLTYGRISDTDIKIAFAHRQTIPTSGNLAKITFTAKDTFDTATAISINSVKCSTNADDFEYPQTASVTINPIVDLQSISVSPTTLNLNKGQTGSLTATKNPSNTTDNTEISWSSSNSAVATVDNNGRVFAVGKGTATITATCGDKTASATVNVTVALEGLHISTETFTLTKGGSTTAITASKEPADTDDTSDIVWTTSDESVVTISNATGTNPTINAVGGGTATITATCGSFSKTCTITVNVPLESINLNYTGTTTEVTDKITVEKGKTVPITATKSPTDTTVTDEITWTIADTSIATVSSGTITGVSNGTTSLQVACGGQVYRTVPVEVINPITAIEIDGGETFELKKNQTKDLTVSYTPEDTTTSAALSWTSSDESIATVDGTGKVTAVAPGTATITATLVANTEIKDTVTVTVPVVSATEVVINKTETTIETGNDEQLSAYVLPEDTTDEINFAWTSSDETVATVDNTGKVTAVGPGTAIITVTSGTLSSTCTVNVTRKLDSLSLNMTDVTIARGDKSDEAIEVTFNPTNTTVDRTTLVIKSLNEAVATVDSDGYINAVSAGTAYIEASVGDIKATCQVTVIVPLVSVTIDNNTTDMELVKNTTGEMSVTLNPEDATEVPTPTWTSSDETVATVDSTGKVTAVKAGTATITVDYGDGITSTRNVKVTEIPATGITLENTFDTMLKGEANKKTLEPKANPEDTTDEVSFEFASSDEEVATVDENGNVIGLKEGTVTITITMKNAETSAVIDTKDVDITVKEIHIDSIAPLDGKENLTGKEGDTLYITVKPTPSNTTDLGGYTYTSSNESIATVDSTGKVTTKKPGTVYITVTSIDDPTVTCQVKVTVQEKVVQGNNGNAGGGAAAAPAAVVASAAATVISPHTGDMNIALLIVMMISSLLGMAIIVRKK